MSINSTSDPLSDDEIANYALSLRRAYALCEEFRPDIPAGVRGWEAKGALDLGLIARLAQH